MNTPANTIHVLQAHFRCAALEHNVQTILTAAERAHRENAAVLLTPALALCGGPTIGGLLHNADFIAECQAAFERIVAASRQWPALTLCLGHPHWADGDTRPFNTVSAIRAGLVIARHSARYLQNTAALNEPHHLRRAPDQTPAIIHTADGTSWALSVGRDAWAAPQAPSCVQASAAAWLVCGSWDWRYTNPAPIPSLDDDNRSGNNTSPPQPYPDDADWAAQLAQLARHSARPIVCANTVGGFDAHVFAGASQALDATGAVTARAADFAEQTLLVRYTTGNAGQPISDCTGPIAAPLDELHACWAALVCAVRDYACDNAFAGIALGLSGGVDSALVLALAVDALGADRVRTFMMPSPFTAQISLDDAAEMARRLRVRHDTVPIEPLMHTFTAALDPVFTPSGITLENLQARSRGTLLMALSNQEGRLVLTTSNKSESAVGYSTLYGDMAGGFAPIKDLLKTQVFALARWRNAHDPFGTGASPIPERIITRPPSAELRPEQRDEDSLMPYPILDDILARHLHLGQSRQQLLAAGHHSADVDKVLRLLRASEYKRAQAPQGPIISRSHTGAFGPLWTVPLTHGFLPTSNG